MTSTLSQDYLKIKNLHYKSNDKIILNDISLTLKKGRIMTVIGPNGAGKTTLLRLILGVLKPTSGEIILKKGLKIGYVPQKITVDETIPLTVKAFLKIWRNSPLKDIEATLELFDIKHTLSQDLYQLSGGEMQKLLIARALLSNPDLLILDEPAQGVDVYGQTEIYKILAKLSKQNHYAILMVSHDLHFVMAKTDEVLCLNRHICCHGHPEEVSKNPDYLSLFGKEGKHLAVYHHSHNHTHDKGETPS